MIPFNIPYLSGDESVYVQQAIQSRDISGNGSFGHKCQDLLQNITGCLMSNDLKKKGDCLMVLLYLISNVSFCVKVFYL